MSERRSGTYNVSRKKEFRRALRNSLTAAEATLWSSLQRRQLAGKKFRRQVSIGPYIVDFYCPERRLVIELDGAAFSPTIDEYEAARTRYLERERLTVIRFENRELKEDIEAILDRIRRELGIDA